MSDFLTEADCAPNMNAATIAGRVIKAEPLSGRTPGITFVVAYRKHWPNGATQEIPIRCYVTGQERIQKLHWLQPGETILAHGEITDRGALYCHRLEHLSKPERVPGEDDEFLAGMQKAQSH